MSLKDKVEEARKGSTFVSWDVIDAIVEEIETLKRAKPEEVVAPAEEEEVAEEESETP